VIVAKILNREDVVIEFDGKKIQDNQDFLMAVANTAPGKKAKIKIVRQGQEKELEITLAERKFENQEKDQYNFDQSEEKPKLEIGLSFDVVPPSLKITNGALVTSVKPGGLADEAGLSGPFPGGAHVIIAANGKPVNNPNDLLAIVKGVKSGEAVIFKFVQITGPENTETCYTSIIKP
jgi:serine protease Do